MLDSNDDTDMNVEYVGFIDEILELDYGRHCVVVLVYSWRKTRSGGPNPTTKQDDFGFTMVNFSHSALIPLGPMSFVFPINIQQVYYANDSDLSDWKILCRVDVRGRRGGRHFALSNLDGLLSVGPDCDFRGFNCDQESPVATQPTNAGLRVCIPEEAPDSVDGFEHEQNNQMVGNSSEEE